MTNTVLDYAVMAMDSYSRGNMPDIPALEEIYDRIRVPLPEGAVDVGFDASVYSTGGEIVISFRGTDFDFGGQLLDDFFHGWLFAAGDATVSQLRLRTHKTSMQIS